MPIIPTPGLTVKLREMEYDDFHAWGGAQEWKPGFPAMIAEGDLSDFSIILGGGDQQGRDHSPLISVNYGPDQLKYFYLETDFLNTIVNDHDKWEKAKAMAQELANLLEENSPLAWMIVHNMEAWQ
jgi:hypothetical protein